MLHKGLEHFGHGTFYEWPALEQIKIPSTVQISGEGALHALPSLWFVSMVMKQKGFHLQWTACTRMSFCSYWWMRYQSRLEKIISLPLLNSFCNWWLCKITWIIDDIVSCHYLCHISSWNAIEACFHNTDHTLHESVNCLHQKVTPVCALCVVFFRLLHVACWDNLLLTLWLCLWEAICVNYSQVLRWLII